MIPPTCRDFPQGYFIVCVVLLLFLLIPTPTQRSAACVWLINALVHGLGALYFIGSLSLLCVLLKDAYEWLTVQRRACSTPVSRPIALEDGTAAPTDAPSSDGDSDTSAPTPSSARSMFLLLFSAFLALCLIIMCWIGGIVSLKRPLSENLRNLVIFLFDGFPVVLVLFIGLALWVLKQRLAARRWAAAAHGSLTLSVGERELGVAAAKEATEGKEGQEV